MLSVFDDLSALPIMLTLSAAFLWVCRLAVCETEKNALVKLCGRGDMIIGLRSCQIRTEAVNEAPAQHVTAAHASSLL